MVGGEGVVERVKQKEVEQQCKAGPPTDPNGLGPVAAQTREKPLLSL